GVIFRLVQLDLTDPQLADISHLRNVAAYKWFGDDTAVVRDPFGPSGEPISELERLNDQLLEPISDCDRQLAFVYWTASTGIVWIDNWAARRPIVRPDADCGPITISDRRWARGLAMLLQFQEHLDWLRAQTTSFTLKVTDVFRRLPPVGLVPLA